jgi:hypothetical protein
MRSTWKPSSRTLGHHPPSAPPHDEGPPSVPVLDDMNFVPSAPPMDGYYAHEDVAASAAVQDSDIVLPTQENTRR